MGGVGVYKRLPDGKSPILFVRGLGTTVELPEWSSTRHCCDHAGVLSRLQKPTVVRLHLRANHSYLEFASEDDATTWRERLLECSFAVDYAQIQATKPGSLPSPAVSSVSVPGLQVIPEAVSAEDEARCIAFIEQQPWERKIKRRVQHYGYEFEYLTKLPGEVQRAIPDCFQQLAPGFHQCTVNEYLPGVGIAPHVDTHSCFGDVIVVISLLAPITMDFTTENEKQSLYIPRRSKMILEEASRYQYFHGIASRKSDVFADRIVARQRRVSLTFRTLRAPDSDGRVHCQCVWPLHCDSQRPAARTAPRRLRAEN